MMAAAIWQQCSPWLISRPVCSVQYCMYSEYTCTWPKQVLAALGTHACSQRTHVEYLTGVQMAKQICSYSRYQCTYLYVRGVEMARNSSQFSCNMWVLQHNSYLHTYTQVLTVGTYVHSKYIYSKNTSAVVTWVHTWHCAVLPLYGTVQYTLTHLLLWKPTIKL